MSLALERQLRLRCSRAHAFDVFTTKLDLWWPPSHRHFERSRLELEPGEGGRFIERSVAGEEFVFGVVLRWEPPSRLTYSWRPGGTDLGPTEVDVRFSAISEAETLIEVTHHVGRSGLDEDTWPKRALRFGAGWDVVLGALDDAVTQAIMGDEHEE